MSLLHHHHSTSSSTVGERRRRPRWRCEECVRVRGQEYSTIVVFRTGGMNHVSRASRLRVFLATRDMMMIRRLVSTISSKKIRGDGGIFNSSLVQSLTASAEGYQPEECPGRLIHDASHGTCSRRECTVEMEKRRTGVLSIFLERVRGSTRSSCRETSSSLAP